MSNVAGSSVTACVPQSYSRSMGNKDAPLRYIDSELLKCLRYAAIISVRRQAAYNIGPNGNIKPCLRGIAILQFCVDTSMPKEYCWDLQVTLPRSISSVDKIYFRRQHGHIPAYCRGSKRCKLCAGLQRAHVT